MIVTISDLRVRTPSQSELWSFVSEWLTLESVKFLKDTKKEFKFRS